MLCADSCAKGFSFGKIYTELSLQNGTRRAPAARLSLRVLPWASRKVNSARSRLLRTVHHLEVEHHLVDSRTRSAGERSRCWPCRRTPQVASGRRRAPMKPSACSPQARTRASPNPGLPDVVARADDLLRGACYTRGPAGRKRRNPAHREGADRGR